MSHSRLLTPDQMLVDDLLNAESKVSAARKFLAKRNHVEARLHIQLAEWYLQVANGALDVLIARKEIAAQKTSKKRKSR